MVRPTAAPVLVLFGMGCVATADDDTPDLTPDPTPSGPAFSLSDEWIDLGTVAAPAEIVASWEIRNHRDEEVSIDLTWTGPSPDLSLVPTASPLLLAPDELRTLSVSWAPDGNSNLAAELTFAHDSGLSIVLPIFGLAQAPQIALSWEPSADFGELALGCSGSSSLRIESVGGLPLHVAGTSVVANSPQDWFLDDTVLPALLAPGENLLLPVIWTPSAPGPAIVEISVESDDPLVPQMSVEGTGQVPDPGITTHPALVEARTDLVLVQSQGSLGWCEPGSRGEVEVWEFWRGLISELLTAQVDFLAVGTGASAGGMAGGQFVAQSPGGPLVTVTPSTPNLPDAVAGILVGGTSQSGDQAAVAVLADQIPEQGFIEVRRPGARLVVVVLSKWGGTDDAADLAAAVAALDNSVETPQLWSVHASAPWTTVPDALSVLGDLVALHGGVTHELCTLDFTAFRADLLDLSATPTRLVPIPGVIGQPVAARHNGSPLTSWAWDPLTGLIDLGLDPDVGDFVELDLVPPPVCP